ncbi:MAG: hypothetical protein OK438_04390 [Thaumarchaeota archaeon]|nr:hypothetical protein [Nitrososphaerota archaeon]
MANASIDVLGSFKLNHWYKLAIYLGAVLIILGFVFVNNSNVAKYTSFAVDSLVLGLIVWMLDDTIYAIGSSRIEGAHYDDAKREVAKNYALAIFVVRWFGLVLWILIILTSL